MPLQIVSFLGLVAMIACAWGLSQHRKQFPWRVVFWGLGLQMTFALLILKTSFGARIFEIAQKVFLRLIDFALEGAAVVVGPLAKKDLMAQVWGANHAFILAVTVIATIVLISALSSLFYHWGILQRVVRWTALVMQKCMGTSGSESLAAAANILMGQTEAPLVVKPYLAGMTRSELMAMMSSGMATIAGSVLGIYVSLGIDSGHLLTASVLSAPAALLMAKVMIPETSPSETASTAPLKIERQTVNSIDALCRGASDGLVLALNVIAMLIAFVAIVALANFTLELLLRPMSVKFTLQQVFGWFNVPFAWLMGVPSKDCMAVSQVLGERIVLNEFLGYLTLTGQKAALEERSYILATYALCGFANFGSIAIQVGGIGALVPSRRNDLARLGLRAMIAGILASYQTACLVGVML